MADQRDGGIAWTDESWNPIRGCTRVSEGCRNCYAERVAGRFSGQGQPYEGLATIGKAGARWTGKVRFVEEHLEDPLRWRRPRRIFVNSMSDLFHPSLTDEQIGRVFRVMEATERHTFQVLTKRPERAAHYTRNGMVPGHIWIGTSVEDQATADERIPRLLDVHARVRFLSVEPQLGPVNLRAYLSGVHWVIVGGESGGGARSFDVEWARRIVRDCKAAGVACFVKQLGAIPMMSEADWRAMRSAPLLSASPKAREPAPGMVGLKLHSSKGAEPDEWPPDLRVREFPEARAHAAAIASRASRKTTK